MYENNIMNALIRNDFYAFVQKVFYELGNTNFVSNWSLELICAEVERVRQGENHRLIINVPPRSLKSIIVNVALPAWILGHNPRERIVSVSYSDELAQKFARDCKTVMESDWYKTAFPKTLISKTRSTPGDFTTTARGGRYATSVEGTMTGRGGNFIIIDDPIKPGDAMSESARKKVIDWYQHTLRSRLDNPNAGTMILIMQRVHEGDLTGYLLESSSDWRHISIPAIATTDEHWKIGERRIRRRMGRPINAGLQSLDVLRGIESDVGHYVWNAQYQQDPCSAQGGIIKPEWLQYYTNKTFNVENLREIIISWDTANKTGPHNAYSVATVFLVMRESDAFKIYLVGIYRGKWEMPDLVKEAIDIYNSWRFMGDQRHPTTMLIEDQASGTQLIQLLDQEYDRRGYKFNVIPIKPTSDKMSRLIGASAYIQSGKLAFPATDDEWWTIFKKELLGFPGTKYKDQVDSLSQAVNYILTPK